MVSKKIALGKNFEFESITAGKAHFDKILKETELGTRVPAQAFRELKALYEEYCRKTNWPSNSPPVGFFPMYERGKGYTTRCFGVEFEDGSKDRFSLDKALSAVAI
jgi:hypothetical protein